MEEFIPFASQIFDAVVHGQWWAAVSAVLAALAFFVRKHPERLPDKLQSVPVLVGLTFGLSFAGGLVNALAAGAGLSWVVVQTAIQIAFAAIGGWAGVELVLKLWFPSPLSIDCPVCYRPAGEPCFGEAGNCKGRVA